MESVGRDPAWEPSSGAPRPRLDGALSALKLSEAGRTSGTVDGQAVAAIRVKALTPAGATPPAVVEVDHARESAVSSYLEHPDRQPGERLDSDEVRFPLVEDRPKDAIDRWILHRLGEPTVRPVLHDPERGDARLTAPFQGVLRSTGAESSGADSDISAPALKLCGEAGRVHLDPSVGVREVGVGDQQDAARHAAASIEVESRVGSAAMTGVSIGEAMDRVLVVDDEENIRHLLLVILKKAGFDATAVPGATEALKVLEKQDFGIVLSDIRMPGMDGRELLRRIVASGRRCYTIMMSAYGGDEIALACMKEGAYDYFNKPFKADEVVLLIRKALERESLSVENDRLRGELGVKFSFDNIIGRSPEMERILETVRKIAPYKTTVLVTGESGTGKELLARALHRNSPRGRREMVAVNCGAIPENLLESELFGHAKGAFTGAIKAKKGLFQIASGSTLFLDEIGELPLSLQVKLLRVLETEIIRPVGATATEKIDVRLVAATSRIMEEEVRGGRFREDLYYRLNVLHVRVPPLRRRLEDIPPLVDHFLDRFARKFGRKLGSLSTAAMDAVLAYPWPGNIRELENSLERGVLLSDTTEVGIDGFPPEVREGRSLRMPAADEDDLSIKRRTATLEAKLIRRALEQTGGNRTQACKLLQISHRALLYKIKDYAIEIPPHGRGA